MKRLASLFLSTTQSHPCAFRSKRHRNSVQACYRTASSGLTQHRPRDLTICARMHTVGLIIVLSLLAFSPVTVEVAAELHLQPGNVTVPCSDVELNGASSVDLILVFKVNRACSRRSVGRSWLFGMQAPIALRHSLVRRADELTSSAHSWQDDVHMQHIEDFCAGDGGDAHASGGQLNGICRHVFRHVVKGATTTTAVHGGHAALSRNGTCQT